MRTKKVLIVLALVFMIIGFTATSSFAWEICGKVRYIKPYQDWTAIGFIRYSDSWEHAYQVSENYGNQVTIITSAQQALSLDSYVKIYVEDQKIIGIAVFEPGVNQCAP